MKGSFTSHSQPQPVPRTGSLVLEAPSAQTLRADAGINTLHGDVMWAAALRRLPLFSTLSEGRLRLITRAASMKTFGSQEVVRPMNYFAMSYDHRIIDGREAVLGLVAMKEALEDPARLLFDI